MIKAFVNRVEQMKCLRKVLKYDRQETLVLVFIGIGGMGKTALRAAFEKYVLKPKKVPYALLDYDGDTNLRPIEATLRAIRRQLGRHKVKTPVFDFLYARYFELSTGFKISAKNCPPELEDVATILDGIPVVGNVTQILFGLSQLGLTVKERVQHKKWLYRIRDLEPREILNLLPEVLAEDLEEAMFSQAPKVLKTSGSRITLLFDAYERISESQIDDTLHRKLLLFAPHLLRVIFTRDKLLWERKYRKEWKDKITHSLPLDDLSSEDTRLFLGKKNVDRPELQEHLFHLTGGYPLHLELCADICREIEETTNKKPQIQDFEGAAQAKDLTKELVNRLLRQLKGNEQDLMGLAAYPRWVSEDVLEELSSVPESVERIFQKFKRLSMFSPHPEIAEAYVIRKEVRDCLLSQQPEERLWKEGHRKLSTYHRECWEENYSFHHLREALYHRFYENPEEAMKMFEEHFWNLLEKFRFGEAESLLGSVPEETLSKEQKRKVKYARARLLATSMQSQQSLITAKGIYELLIESESDEACLEQYLFYFGSLQVKTGKYNEALKYYKKALTIRLKIYGQEDRKVCDVYSNIGNIYAEMYELKKALHYHEKSIAVRRKLLGEEHTDVANSYNSIGNIFSSLGEYKKAIIYYHNALAIHLKIHGEEHPDVASSYNNMGVVCFDKGEYDNALNYFEKSLDIWFKIYGAEHPMISIAYRNIGSIYVMKGNYKKSLKYQQKGLTICRNIYVEEHPDTASFYGNLGYIYRKLKRYEKAIEYYQKTLSIFINVYGEEHPSTALTYDNLGDVTYDQRNYNMALGYYHKGLNIRIKIFGNEHPGVASSCAGIASSLWVLKREDEAIEKMKQSIKIYRKFRLWKDAVEGLETLAGWLKEKGKTKEAEEACAEAGRIRIKHEIK